MELKLNPSNPRTIKEDKFEKLKKSIESFTKMLEIRPIAYDDDNVIWGGNMRYLALCKLGIEQKPEYFKKLEGFTLEEKREFAIKDNLELGDMDWDIVANEWSDLPLDEWGLNVGDFNKSFDDVNKEIDVNELGNDLDIECPKCHFKFKNV